MLSIYAVGITELTKSFLWLSSVRLIAVICNDLSIHIRVRRVIEYYIIAVDCYDKVTGMVRSGHVGVSLTCIKDIFILIVSDRRT